MNNEASENIRVSSYGKGNDAHIVNKSPRLLSLKGTSKNVIPAKAGIQSPLTSLASRLPRSDKLIIIRGSLNSLHVSHNQ